VGDGSCEVSIFLLTKLVELSNVEISMRGLGCQSGKDVVRYIQRPWGVHINVLGNRGSKGMDRYPLTDASKYLHKHLE
jgi:hypothetical protein